MPDMILSTQDVIQKLVDIVKEEGMILFSNIPSKLAPIDYKMYSNGKGLKAWLTTFPEFATTEDGLALLLAGTNPTYVNAPASATSIAEVRNMHAFAYMNHWPHNLKQLKLLGDFPELKADFLRDHIAHVLMQGLLMGQLEIDSADTQQPLLALDTGLKLADRHPVYAVLGLNPANTDGSKQVWALKGFCSDAETDKSELGNWLRAYLGGSQAFDYTDLSDQIEELTSMKVSVKAAVEAFLSALDGEICPELAEGSRLSERISEYEGRWETLMKILESFPSLMPDTALSLPELRASTSKEAFRSNLLREALDTFETMACGMRDFFAAYRWDAEDDCSPMKDCACLRKQYGGAFNDPNLTLFAQTLDVYRSFWAVVSAESADEAYYNELMVVTGHFPELPQNLRIASRLLIDIPEEERAFLGQIEEIQRLLDQYITTAPVANDHMDIALPQTGAQLLQLAMRADADYQKNWPLYLKAALPEEEEVRALIGQDAEPGCELSCYGAANRLLEAGYRAYAERYLIFGLMHDGERCALALLKLYREDQREEDFAAVWSAYSGKIPYTQEDESFWFSTLCQRSPEQALELSRNHIHLQYQSAYLSNLATAAEALEQTELADTLRARLARFDAGAQPNALEAAVIRNDREAIAAMAQSEQLQDLGYDDKQIQMILDAAEADEYPSGNTPYEIGSRLFLFQGNRNSLAEQWMWQGVSKKNQESYADLLRLLMQQQRWSEAAQLYEASAESQKRFEECRQLYLICRYNQSPVQAQKVFRENLQDVLAILNRNVTFREKCVQSAQEPGQEFYGLLLKLHAAVSDPYLWSVVCEDRSLRDRAHDQERLKALGLDVTVIGEVYRSGMYPHGRDAVSTAQRLYALAGNLASAAELAAQLAGQNKTARKLLWTIYNEEQNETALFELLTDDEALRGEHYAQYLGFLYARGELAAFLELLQENADLSEQQLLQRATAELKLGRPMTDSPEICADTAASCSAEACLDLLKAAASADNIQLITQILCGCFDNWLLHQPQQLQKLVTCGGSGTVPMLEAVQSSALERDMLPLAVYIQNVLKIGDVRQQAELLHSQIQAQLSDEDIHRQLLCLQKLQYLYPEQADALSAQSASISIQALLLAGDNGDKQETAEKLEALILSFGSNPAMFDITTQLLKGTEYCQDYRVYTAIRNYGRQIGRLTDTLLYLHEASRIGDGEPHAHFRDYLVRLYFNALAEERFPKGIAEEAEALCFQSLKQSGSAQAALTIAMLEQQKGRPIYANAVLNHLAVLTNSQSDFPKSVLTGLGMEALPVALQLTDPLPTILQLFEQVLDAGSEEEILRFLRFCQTFVSSDPQSLQQLRNLRPDQSLSEQQSILAVNLLCSDPEKAEYWELCAHITFSAGDGGRASFLHLCCRKNPNRWKEYVQLCETLSSAPERLAAALAAWSETPEPYIYDCRTYIEEKLEKYPSYLEELDDPDSLCLMTGNLCRQLKEWGLNLNHAQLRAVALIAVRTGEPECLNILQQEMGFLLLGSKSDLGVVVLSRLLLAGRFEEAHALLISLHNSLAVVKYRALIDELADYDANGLHAWTQEPSSRMFLELILPDGNQPNISQVGSIAADALLNGTQKEAAAVLARVMQVFPDDYVTAYELLELCKTGFEGSLPLLHSCLVTLARISADQDNVKLIKSFEDRQQNSHLISLAILNQLIIHTHQMDAIDDGWNFAGNTAQGLETVGVIVPDHALIAAAEQRVRDSLNNQSAEISALRVHAWFANITGNWTEYLRLAYRAGQQPDDVFFPADNIDSCGFLRSVLLLLSQAEGAQLHGLLYWLSKLTPASQAQTQQLKVATELYQGGVFADFRESMGEKVDRLLRFPTENGRLFKKLSDTVLQPMLMKEPDQLYPLARMLCSLSSRYAMYTVHGIAEECFSKERDGVAWSLYRALFETGRTLRISHSCSTRFASDTAATGGAFSYNMEEYQTKMRICGTFSGKPECIQKLAEENLSPWSTINLVLCLASARADEIDRLKSYMAPEIAYFAERVRMILSKLVSDADKLETLRDTRITTLGRYYLAKMIRFEEKQARPPKPYYLRSAYSIQTVAEAFSNLYNSCSPDEKKLCKHVLLCKGVSSWNVDAAIDLQKDATAWKQVAVVRTAAKNYVYSAPDYVAELTAEEYDPEALQMLQQQYRKINTSSHSHFSERARLSGLIYRHVIGSDQGAEACYRALLRYSVDRFYDLISDGTQQSRQQAFRLLITLMETDDGSIHEGEEYEALVEMVNAVGAADLIKSYSHIRQLTESYGEHTAAFAKLRSMILDKVVFRDLGIIYEVLEKLAKEFALFGSSDADKLIKALSEADTRIGAMNGAGAASIKSQLQRMIRSELTALSRRAILDIQLLNMQQQPRNGNLTGIIRNKGTVKAENLTLQAFCDTMNSDQYTLRQLLPNEKAIFEIPYECVETQERLKGRLDLVGRSGETMVSAQYEFSLDLGTTSGDNLLYNTYQTDRPRFTFDPQTRSVKSSNFFGRSVETARMRELVAGDCFADFHSAVVYGVRRTGKTSLLEYFRRYVQGTHPECLCIRIDVQATNETIHSVFVKCVLQEASVVEALESCSERDIFVEKWNQYDSLDAEMDPKLISVFFRELYQLTGKGMILIIDEIDRLFKSMIDGHKDRALNDLLSAMSGLLDNDDRKEYLQLVICGSNWLMYYATVGYDMQQVFHRFGDYKITVGRLPKEDVLELLSSADVNYAAGAMELIWEYTGGLVWFVKLLGNAAIRRAKAANRSWVYPADVFFSLPDVVTDLNCAQFYEGCPSGSLEWQMIDVMQSLAYRKDMYLSMDTICELLGRNPHEVEQALSSLIHFEIAERNPVNPDMVRFCLDIYRRYFRTTHSSYKHIPEETVVFEPRSNAGTAVTLTALSEVYADDEEI